MRVLGIESSCDETGVAIYCTERGLLCNLLKSQTATHAPYGGVVPELASRDHIRFALPMIQEALTLTQLEPQDLDGLAYTKGPGLIGGLLVGASVVRSLSYAWGKPAIGVHHMEAHLLAVFLENNPPPLPFVALLVSGGHTLLVAVEALGVYRILGQSVDDAAGEAFDKTAKLLGLPQPGGPQIAALAKHGNPKRFHFPRPMLHSPSLNFSFSGLKTHAREVIAAHPLTPENTADIAIAFEMAVVETIAHKCLKALQETGFRTLVMAGGVSANIRLRETLSRLGEKQGLGIFYPALKLCTDNGAMIAVTGALRMPCEKQDPFSLAPKPRWSLESLSPIIA